MSREEIRELLKDKSPLPEISLGIFDDMVDPARMARRVIGDASGNPPTTALLAQRGSLDLITTQRVGSIASTGNAHVDDAVVKMRDKAVHMAVQAAMYDSLRAVQTGEVPIPAFEELEVYFKKLGEKKGDEGVFWPLNRDFLIAMAVAQYRFEVEVHVEHRLQQNLVPSSGKHNVQGFREAISAIPVEGREIIWKVAEKPVNTKREFLAAQEDVRNALGVKFLPQYIDTFTLADFDYVLNLVDGKLRDLQVAVPVVNWCLDVAPDGAHLLRLLDNELRDATFIRYQSLELGKNDVNPYTQGVHQNEPNEKTTVPEEIFFTNVFKAILLRGKLGFQIPRQRMILDIVTYELDKKRAGMAFRFETLLRHIELLLLDDDNVPEFAPILVELGKIFADQAATQGTAIHTSGAGEDLAERIQYLREEVVIREKGWFPPTSRTFGEIVQILHREHWTETLGEEGRPSALELAAARRAFKEISSEVVGLLGQDVTAAGSTALRSGRKAALISQCLSGIVKAALEWPDDDENGPPDEGGGDVVIMLVPKD